MWLQDSLKASAKLMLGLMYHIPTPKAKRAMDDELCFRFHKRLRLDAPAEAYALSNDWLRQLHAESSGRRQAAAVAASCMDVAAPSTPSMQMDSCEARFVAADGGMATTSFSIADVVQCSHGPGGRCLMCSGRHVQNVPLGLYGAFCTAYGSRGGSSSSSSCGDPLLATMVCSSGVLNRALVRASAVAAAELSFPAIASLVACLAPSPGERLLHLGSGSGRVVLGWSLLLPQSAASGVEATPELHIAAAAAAARLALEEQHRVFLHQGDPFATQGEWRHAGVILISGACLEDSVVGRTVEALESVEPGTRVVTCSRPLRPDGRAPPGFTLERQAAYRTVGAGNMTLYIYRRSAPD